MLPMLPTLFTLLRSPLALRLGAVALVAILAWGAYLVIDSRATARAESVCAVVAEQVQSQMLHDLLAAQEEAHQYHLAEIARGERISAELAKTQRRLDATKTEYLTYAHAITGVCDPSFRVLVEYASGATSVPDTPGTPADGPVAEDALERAYQEAVARIVGANIADNYSRLDFCVAEKRALNAWHKEGVVK